MNPRYKARALRHIEAIHDYIAQDDPAAAVRVLRRIEYSVARLAILPSRVVQASLRELESSSFPVCPIS
jgi:plasmid stabilization system protein ParE